MALKRQYDMTALFSMASMTDIIFLLLIFFMVTSTLVFPTALEVNLPQSTEQTAIRPAARLYVMADSTMLGQIGDADPQLLTLATLDQFIAAAGESLPEGQPCSIAIYADETVPYGRIVPVLDRGAKSAVKMVLATKAPGATANTTDIADESTQPAQ
ncbi:MAG: biopolymer transporter ExbD [Paramuribaculum sp.]|nr:biopolymer transporter ExbD [Paramuribaculum sp.]